MHAVHTVFFDHCVREYPNAPHAFSIEVNAIFTDQNVNTWNISICLVQKCYWNLGPSGKKIGQVKKSYNDSKLFGTPCMFHWVVFYWKDQISKHFSGENVRKHYVGPLFYSHSANQLFARTESSVMFELIAATDREICSIGNRFALHFRRMMWLVANETTTVSERTNLE